ncbi:MAG: hypothetical protein XD49_1286 [Caldanaerobacter subterraneus]|nr:MAG: hypothetical protein XD49_1286 [Caldanaerobacter subterraneus]
MNIVLLISVCRSKSKIEIQFEKIIFERRVIYKMAKKSNILQKVIEDITKEEKNKINLFVEYIMTLYDDNYGLNGNTNYLANKYDDILKFYEERIGNENED